MNQSQTAEKEGYEYEYAILGELLDIYIDGNKHEPVSSKDISSIDAINMTVTEHIVNGNNEIHLSLSTEELIDEQINDTFCTTIIKLINDKEVP